MVEKSLAQRNCPDADIPEDPLRDAHKAGYHHPLNKFHSMYIIAV